MQDEDELTRWERERKAADRAYNDALTAFDAALIHAAPIAGASLRSDVQMPPIPAGWRARWLRVVVDWLRPWFESHQAAHARTADALESLLQHERERAAQFERFQGALIVFLQQITAFVESKDRQLQAIARADLDGMRQIQIGELETALKPLADVQSRLSVLQRATQMLERRVADAAAAGSGPTAVAATSTVAQTALPSVAAPASSYKYVAFEDHFRGSDDAVAEKSADHVAIFAGAANVVDLGCGRGELLAALQAAGITARGVDTNDEMVAIAKARGLDVEHGDALSFVAAMPDDSLGGAIAIQVVEHLEPAYLMALLDTLSHKLRRGAPLVIETINVACWYAFFSSYMRDITHVRPLHPETLQYFVRASGFERVEIRYKAPLPDHARLRSIEVPREVRVSADPQTLWLAEMADAITANAGRLNRLAFAEMDYAVIGYHS